MVVGGVSTTPRPLYPQERTSTHCTGGWVGPRAGLDGCGKSRRHRNSIPGHPRTVQSVASNIRELYVDKIIDENGGGGNLCEVLNTYIASGYRN